MLVQVRYSSHMAILSTLLCLASLFPRVRLEVEHLGQALERHGAGNIGEWILYIYIYIYICAYAYIYIYIV